MPDIIAKLPAYVWWVFAFLVELEPANPPPHYPEPLTPYVSDYVGLLDAATRERITDRLIDVRRERNQEVALAIIDSRKNYGEHPSIESFATGLFNQWGIGNADRNDGILVLVARKDRGMRIELGRGYPGFFDAQMGEVIQQEFLPRFRERNFGEGIERGVDEILYRTGLDYEPQGYTLKSKVLLGYRQLVNAAWSPWLGGLLLSGGGLFGWRRYLRNRPPRCEICGRKMVRLSEAEEDERLVAGQQLEEELGSKDYDVWICAAHDRVVIKEYDSWLTTYTSCKSCGYKTYQVGRAHLRSRGAYPYRSSLQALPR